MKWDLIITNPARRDLRKLPRDIGEDIADVLESMCDEPLTGNIRKIEGTRNPVHFRRRIGDYRIIFYLEVETRRVYIIAVRRRNEKTYRDY